MEIETDSSVEKEYYGNETYYKILTFSLKEVEY